MPDLSADLRLAVETGSISFGIKETIKAITQGKAKVAIVASSSKGDNISDITHACKLAGTKLLNFKGNPVELGAVCGKPFGVSTLAILDPGASKILEENYD
ncbi:MAG: 50S ribosomal protein L30e [Candidatus Micrarchaeaceae archaeon]